MAIHVVEVCHVTPSKGAPKEQILPLQNLEILRLPYHLLNFLFFYKHPCSESQFLNTIIPTLIKSLSLTLKHFLPLAGNIVFPLNTSATPFSRYVDGDSVSVTFAVSNTIFNHPRDSDQFLPRTLPQTYSSNNAIAFSPLAIQVTLLPSQGICIGVTADHAVSDGGKILDFLRAWASVNKSNTDNAHLRDEFSPSRDAISLAVPSATNKVRATFLLMDGEIQTLKTIALNKNPSLALATSCMVILSGYLWSCLAKAAAIVGEAVSDDETEYLTCTADPVLVVAESTHGLLKGKEGFVSAAHAIGEAILNNKKGNVLGDLEHRMKVKGGNKRVVTIAGSPRFEMYGLDYGFGRPNKFEYPTNDCDESVFLCKPRGGKGTEIIMSMNKAKMDAFAACFRWGLEEIAESTYIIQSNL